MQAYTKTRRCLFSLFLCLFLTTAFFAIATIQPGQAHAATEMPSYTKFPTSNLINLGTGQGFKVTKGEDVKSRTGTGDDGVARTEYIYKVSDNDAHREAFLTLQKDNVATIEGESINLKVVVDYLNFDSIGAGRQHKSYVVFATQRYDGLYLGSYNSALNYGFKSGTKSRYNICCHVYFTWAKTNDVQGHKAGATVNRKFLQEICDIDEMDEGERWEGNSGYSEFFWYKNNKLKQSANKFSSSEDWNAKTYPNTMLYKAGLNAATSSGDFWFTCHGGNCNTKITLGAQIIPGNPTKTALSKSVDVGEDFSWKITRKMPVLYQDTFSKYQTITFEDKLDSKLKFKSINIKWPDGTSESFTSQNKNLKIDSKTNTVTYSFPSDFYSKDANYNGRNIEITLTTTAVSPGNVVNSALLNYANISTTPEAIVPLNATINYYRDYLTGDTDPVYTDKTTNTSSGYQVNSNATKAAQRNNCAGLTDWYTDAECTQKYTGNWIPNEEDNYTLNLYCKNKVTLSYGITTDSYMKTHPNKTIFTDSLMTSTVTDYSKIFPETKTYYYGDTVDFKKLSDLYYKHAGSSHLLTCSDGIYAYEDGTGDIFTQVRLTCNSTAYYKWKGGNYDGVLTTS